MNRPAFAFVVAACSITSLDSFSAAQTSRLSKVVVQQPVSDAAPPEETLADRAWLERWT
jgi:hypothetical protein